MTPVKKHCIGTGVYNAVAPEQITLGRFTNILAKTTKKIIFPINIPSFMLKIGLGEMSDIVLNGSKICTEKVSNIYDFKYPTLEECLNEIYKKPT